MCSLLINLSSQFLSGVTFDFLSSKQEKHIVNEVHIVTSIILLRSKFDLILNSILTVIGSALLQCAGLKHSMPLTVRLTIGIFFWDFKACYYCDSFPGTKCNRYCLNMLRTVSVKESLDICTCNRI